MARRSRTPIGNRLTWAVGATVATAGAGLGAWAGWVEPRRLVVRRRELHLPGWPLALDGLRVGVIADLHVGAPHIDLAKLIAVVQRLNAEEPEVIAILGDLVTEPMPFARRVNPLVVAQVLTALRAPLGTFTVLGNNDDETVRRALGEAGLRVLDDDVELVERNGGRLWLVGLADVRTAEPDLDGVLDRVDGEAPIVVLTHSPDLFPRIPERVALTLAGHTHGAQINIPVLRRRAVPSWFGDRYHEGHFVERGRHLYVDPGIGTSGLPLRFRAAPQITVLTLRRARSA